MGGAGQLDHTAADDANTALYSAFAVIGFFSGSIINKIGVKYALSFGGLGYSIYVASFLSYNHNKNYGFTVFAGFFLGICAAMLWTAQGTVMISYPREQSKGRYISWFWMIFNMGAVIGSLASTPTASSRRRSIRRILTMHRFLWAKTYIRKRRIRPCQTAHTLAS